MKIQTLLGKAKQNIMSELRLKRSSFTSVLNKMCAALDADNHSLVTWKVFFSDIKFTANIEVLSLWVAGTYARGATDCGDLDIVMEFSAPHPPLPNGRQAGKSIFKNYRRVNIYGGTPSKNESGIKFEEAILIWQGKGFDWEKVISNIKENSTASRYLRPTDSIPFRPEQLAMEVDELEELVKMEEQGVIRWSFTPISDLTPKAPEYEDESEFKRLVSYRAAKTQKLFPYLLAFFSQSNPLKDMLLRYEHDDTRFFVNGSKIYVGCPRIHIGELDRVTTSEIVIAPHITARLPNGIWSIRRGKNHPILASSKGILGYALIDESGHLDISAMAKNDRFFSPTWTCARVLDLFTNKRKAVSWAKQLANDDQRTLTVLELKDNELINTLSLIDILFLDFDEYALTRTGLIALGSDYETSTLDLLPKLMPIKAKTSQEPL
jgi:hypothetical protein